MKSTLGARRLSLSLKTKWTWASGSRLPSSAMSCLTFILPSSIVRALAEVVPVVAVDPVGLAAAPLELGELALERLVVAGLGVAPPVSRQDGQLGDDRASASALLPRHRHCSSVEKGEAGGPPRPRGHLLLTRA